MVKSLVICFRSCSLQKITCYSLQDLLVARCGSCSLQKNHSLLVRKAAHCINSLVTRCRSFSLQNSIVTRCIYESQFQLNLVNYDNKIWMNLTSSKSIFWMFYINQNHVLTGCKFFFSWIGNSIQRQPSEHVL